jgi:DNA-binding transcriptional ArsR family regulator
MGFEGLDGLTSLERYVLVGAAALDLDGQVPFQSYDVRDFCVEHLGSLPGEPFEGGITREAVIRALSKLEGRGLVETDFEDRSPVGKGRPSYRLSVDADELLERLGKDERFADVVAAVER